MMAVIEIPGSRGEAMKVERYLKKQKDRKFIEEVIRNQGDENWIAQLVRVPACRD